MLEFSIIAFFMVLVAVAFIVFPLMGRRVFADTDRSQVNIELFRDRLNELEQEKADELHSDEEFTRLKLDLERRLLNEVQSSETVELSGNTAAPARSRLIWVIALLVPLLAGLIYNQVGAMSDVQIGDSLNELQQMSGTDEKAIAIMSTLKSRIDNRLKQKPEDRSYLMLSGRLAIEQGRYVEASNTFKRLVDLAGDDAVALAQYTQALYLAAGRQLTPEAKAVADRALSVNPGQPTVLGMLGMSSYEQGDYITAVAYWQRLLAVMDPASSSSQMIKQLVQKAQAELPAATASTTGAGGSITGKQLVVNVSLAEGMQAAGGEQVFVFARAVKGPPMPLAVARITVADLPAQIELNDSMAMMQGMNLSSFNEVSLVARISKRGIANPAAGDMEGLVTPVATDQSEPIPLVIDRVLK